MLRFIRTENRTDQSILIERNTARQLLGIILRRKLSFFGHTIRDGGSELVKCEIRTQIQGNWKRRLRRHKTSYSTTSQNGWQKAGNTYCGIALDGGDWCGVRHGRLIITLDGIGKKKNIVLILMSSLIRHVITCHSNAFASWAKSWITSSNFSYAIVHRVVTPRCPAKIINDECKLAKLPKWHPLYKATWLDCHVSWDLFLMGTPQTGPFRQERVV